MLRIKIPSIFFLIGTIVNYSFNVLSNYPKIYIYFGVRKIENFKSKLSKESQYIYFDFFVFKLIIFII